MKFPIMLGKAHLVITEHRFTLQELESQLLHLAVIFLNQGNPHLLYFIQGLPNDFITVLEWGQEGCIILSIDSKI